MVPELAKGSASPTPYSRSLQTWDFPNVAGNQLHAVSVLHHRNLYIDPSKPRTLIPTLRMIRDLVDDAYIGITSPTVAYWCQSSRLS